MLKALMEKVDNMQHKQRDGCYKNQMEMVGIKNRRYEECLQQAHQ